MEQLLHQKARDLIGKSQKILLVTRTHPTDDSVGSLVALGLVFEKMGKEVDLVCHGPLMSSLSFLPKYGDISQAMEKTGDFVISLDTTDSKISQFSYDFDNDGNKLNIYITPEEGAFNPEHVTAIKNGSKYDLVVIVDAKDLEILGGVYEENARIFFETPIINIDSSLDNEQYGEVNCIDVKANATTEVVYLLIQALGEQYFDENIATALLAGIISKTKSFQSKKTNPKAFSAAAQLIQLGADQQRIIHSLFKNKTLNTLKLWGRVLLGAVHDSTHKVISAHALQSDFMETSTSSVDLVGFEDELLASVGDISVIVLFIENKDEIEVFVKFEKENDALQYLEKSAGERLLGGIQCIKKGAHMTDVQREVLGAIKEVLFPLS